MKSRRPTETRVVIADDHAVLRKGLRDIINEEPGFVVVGEAGDGQAALEKIIALAPGLAILDIDMPVRSGLDVAAELGKRNVESRLIALSMHDEEKIFDKAMDLGFSGFILKDGAIADIGTAMKAVMNGKYYISPALTTIALSRSKAANTSRLPTLALLTQTERRILRLIGEGRSTKQIAEELFVSPRTVDSHRANITEKLGLKGGNALLRWAIENKGKI